MKPFDEAAAKRGEPVCYRNGCKITYIRGPDICGDVCVDEDGRMILLSYRTLFMAPLAVVEGKEVYPGDVLYGSTSGAKCFVGADNFNFADGRVFSISDITEGFVGLSWSPPPKLERRWLALYNDGAIRAYTTSPLSWRGPGHQILRIKIDGRWHDISDGVEVEVQK